MSLPDPLRVIPLPELGTEYFKRHGQPLPVSYQRLMAHVMTGALPARRIARGWVMDIDALATLPDLLARLESAEYRRPRGRPPIVKSLAQAEGVAA